MARTKNKYRWSDKINDAPRIEEHTRIKHNIIRDYILSYLKVVGNPTSSHIKLSIVDGLCGGGLYSEADGSAHFGTPIIIIEALKDAVTSIIADRIAGKIHREFSIECDLYFVDRDKTAIETLGVVFAPHLSFDPTLPLKINPHFINQEFASSYKGILSKIGQKKAIFILDPCGYSEIHLDILKEISGGFGSKREIIWTFMIDAITTYRSDDSVALANAGYERILNLFTNGNEPNGFSIQKAIFDTIKSVIGVPFFTPFCIKQKRGWNYWLIHLAHHHRASEVMKEVEHRHADQREHYGKPGLNMMASAGDMTYLFRDEDVERGRKQLEEDLPQMLAKYGDTSFQAFMERTYNETPLVSAVIKEVLIGHDDIEIETNTGGSRSSARRIKINDMIKLKRQTRFFFSL